MDNLIIINHDWKPLEELFIFDLDNTLIKSQGTFPKGINDISLMFPNVIKKLNSNKGIVIMTNQYGLKKGKSLSRDDWLMRLKFLTSQLKVPFMIFISLEKDQYRKPETGMFELFIEKYNSGINPEKKTYIGDALGRETDFSSSDLKFALNCGVNIVSPEYYFEQIENLDYINFQITGYNPFEASDNVIPEIIKYLKEMIIMVGSPCCGKTSFVKEYFPDYIRINQDTLKTKAKCLKTTENTLKECSHNIIIDNTNPNKEVRKEYIDLATKYNYRVRIIVKETTKDLSDHLNVVRCRKEGFDKRLPDIAFRIFWSKYQVPTLEEGVKEIINVPFKANKEDLDFMKYS